MDANILFPLEVKHYYICQYEGAVGDADRVLFYFSRPRVGCTIEETLTLGRFAGIWSSVSSEAYRFTRSEYEKLRKFLRELMRSYKPNSDIARLVVDHSGAGILGFLGKATGFCDSSDPEKPYRIPLVANGEKSAKFGVVIASMSKIQINAFHDRMTMYGWFEGSVEELETLLQYYAEFFMNCKGYTTEG